MESKLSDLIADNANNAKVNGHKMACEDIIKEFQIREERKCNAIMYKVK